MIRTTFLVLASFALSVSCYNCNGTTIIGAPSDISKPTFYPDGWSEGQSIPQVSRNQGCRIDVNIPSGHYATVTFYKHFGNNTGVYALYPNNKIDLLGNDDYKPYIFSSPHFKINLATDNTTKPENAKFAFKINWAKYPVLQKNVVNIYKGKSPVTASASGNLTTFIGDPHSMVSLMAFGLKNSSMNYLLRQTAIFGGDSVFDDYLGTLGQVLSSQQKLTTYGNKMSVYTFGLNNTIDYPLFMAQNLQDTKGVMVYQGVNCPSTGNCTVPLNGNWGNSLTVTDFNGSEYIKGFNTFPDTATIKVYENSISNTTCIATLTSANYTQQMPLEVKGTMKFYELLGHGLSDMVVTREVSTRASRLLI